MHVGDFQHTAMPPQTAFATVVVFVAWKWVRRHCEGHNMAPWRCKRHYYWSLMGGELSDSWPATASVVIYRICGHLLDLWPSTGFVGTYRICGHLLD